MPYLLIQRHQFYVLGALKLKPQKDFVYFLNVKEMHIFL